MARNDTPDSPEARWRRWSDRADALDRALELARELPASIRSATLDGVLPEGRARDLGNRVNELVRACGTVLEVEPPTEQIYRYRHLRETLDRLRGRADVLRGREGDERVQGRSTALGELRQLSRIAGDLDRALTQIEELGAERSRESSAPEQEAPDRPATSRGR